MEHFVKCNCKESPSFPVFLSHGETPSTEQVDMFVRVCDHFIRQKPLEIIGVHCTHGFNRSGFLIISYLVEKMDWRYEVSEYDYAVNVWYVVKCYERKTNKEGSYVISSEEINFIQ